MTVPIDLAQQLEVHDASGSVLGFIVSAKAYRELLAERDALQKRVAELEKERAALQQECADHLRALEYLARPDCPYDPRGLATLERDCTTPLEEAVADLLGKEVAGG
jgi:hypothetical protein